MTHASWNNEKGGPTGPGHDNERLEYLGDAVLELVVGEYLFRRFPGYDEGQLTQLRAALVNTVSLARLAERLQVGEALLLGKGAAKTGAHRLPSLLANAFEAMIGAIFLDQGYRVAVRVFIQNIGDLAEWSDENHKGRLQEVAQERTGATPQYRVSALAGPGHRREYAAEAVVGGEVAGRGTGRTKQAAEQAAARAALEHLETRGKRRRPAPVASASRAAGAAQRAALGAGEESPRVRRRMAEAAADTSASERDRRAPRRPSPPPAASGAPDPAPAAAPSRRRGLLSVLRAAAEVLVGHQHVDDEGEAAAVPAPVAAAEPAEATVGAAPRPSRRGRRGGRGRRRPSEDGPPEAVTGPAGGTASRGGGRRRGTPAAGGGAQDRRAGGAAGGSGRTAATRRRSPASAGAGAPDGGEGASAAASPSGSSRRRGGRGRRPSAETPAPSR